MRPVPIQLPPLAEVHPDDPWANLDWQLQDEYSRVAMLVELPCIANNHDMFCIKQPVGLLVTRGQRSSANNIPVTVHSHPYSDKCVA